MKLLVAALSFLLFQTQAFAEPKIDIKNGWVLAAVPGQPVAAGYLDLSVSEPVTLVRMTSTAAESVEIHDMESGQGVMRMRRKETLSIKPGSPVHLRPGATHLMLLGLKQTLSEGSEDVAFAFHFSDSKGRAHERLFRIPVKAAGVQ